MGAYIIFLYYGFTGLFVGAVLGSFSAAFVYRQAHKISIFVERDKQGFSRSKCPACGHVLSIRDLVPVLSWLSLGGQCRYCKSSISPLYPLIEAISIFFALIILFAWDFSLTSLFYLLILPPCWVIIINGARGLSFSRGLVSVFLAFVALFLIVEPPMFSTILWAFGSSLCLLLLFYIFTRQLNFKETICFAAMAIVVGMVFLPFYLLAIALAMIVLRKINHNISLRDSFGSAVAMSFLFIILLSGVMNIYDLLSSIY